MGFCIFSSQSADLWKEKAKPPVLPAWPSNALLRTMDHDIKTRPSTSSLRRFILVPTKRASSLLKIRITCYNTLTVNLMSLIIETYLRYVQGHIVASNCVPCAVDAAPMIANACLRSR